MRGELPKGYWTVGYAWVWYQKAHTFERDISPTRWDPSQPQGMHGIESHEGWGLCTSKIFKLFQPKLRFLEVDKNPR